MPDSDRHAQLANPHIRLSGVVDQDMYDSFRKQLEACPALYKVRMNATRACLSSSSSFRRSTRLKNSTVSSKVISR